MPFYIFAWIGLISYALVIVVGKLTSKHTVSNPWFFNFTWTFLSLLFTVPIALYNHVEFPKDWTWIIVASIFNALWFIFYTFSTYRLDVSVFSPLFNFRSVFAILFSALILGERLNPEQSFYFIIILLGGIFTSLDEKFNIKSFFSSSVFIGLFAMLSLALNNVFVNKVMQNNGFWEGTLWMLIITQIILLVTLPLFLNELRKVKSNQITPLTAMAILSVIGNICFNIAYKENVSITSLIAAIPASMIFAFLFSIFAPKLLEKHTLKVYIVRFTAAAVMIISALKLST